MKKTLTLITAAIGVALLALLAYSIERSAWLLSLYEAVATEQDSSGLALAMAAAVVAELAAIALIIGESAIGLAHDTPTANRLARWAGFGLLLVLSLQSVAGLIAGYTRGGDRMLAELGSGNEYARFAVAAVALLLGNLMVPGLILALSKIAALLVGQLLAMPSQAAEQATPLPALPAYAYPKPVESNWCASCGAGAPAGQPCAICGHAAPVVAPQAAPIADRQCKHCGQSGLTQADLMRHGRTHSRYGACNRNAVEQIAV